LFNDDKAVTAGEQCCCAWAWWALKYGDDWMGHAEASDESPDFVASDKHLYAKFGSDWWNPFSVSECRDRCATSPERPFNDEISLSEEEPSALIVSFVGSGGEASLSKAKEC